MKDLEQAVRKIVAEEVRKAVRDELAPLIRRLEGKAAVAASRTAESHSPTAIRRMRKRLKLTQRELAALAEVTPVAVYFWEAGRTTPKPESAERLSKIGAMTPKAAKRRAAVVG